MNGGRYSIVVSESQPIQKQEIKFPSIMYSNNKLHQNFKMDKMGYDINKQISQLYATKQY